MDSEFLQLQCRLESAQTQYVSHGSLSWRIRCDLEKMVENVRIIMVAASRERANCNRLHRPTVKYQEHLSAISTALDNLELHITLAHLLNE